MSEGERDIKETIGDEVKSLKEKFDELKSRLIELNLRETKIKDEARRAIINIMESQEFAERLMKEIAFMGGVDKVKVEGNDYYLGNILEALGGIIEELKDK